MGKPMTDLQKNYASAKILVQGHILQECGKGKEATDVELWGDKFTRVPMDWAEAFVGELIDLGLVVATMVQNGEHVDSVLKLA